MANLKQGLGRAGEQAAEAYLRKKGFRVVERNYRCQVGEIDLIALDRRVIVFIEVKTRRTMAVGSPLEAVPTWKQRRMMRAALWFLNQRRLHQRDGRFDVVGITVRDGEAMIEHVRNAFDFVE